MITDAITLQIIFSALSKFEANQGELQDILIEARSNERDLPKSFNFRDLNSLQAEVLKYGTVDWSKLECNEMYFFTLKKFNVRIGDSFRNTVRFNGSKYLTNSRNINDSNLIILNDTYLKSSNEIYSKWKEVKVSEYIKNQRNYIDCGYIEIYFEEDIIKLKELYKKYKKS